MSLCGFVVSVPGGDELVGFFEFEWDDGDFLLAHLISPAMILLKRS